jgi:transposase-like protein
MTDSQEPVPSLEQIQDALSQAKNLDDFFGKNGVVAKLVGPTLEHMMQAELTSHLGYEKHASQGKNSGNSRNGTYERKVKTSAGEIPIEVPRDREGSFEPVTLRRYATASNELEDRIIGMYAHGMSTRDIQDHLQDTFGVEVSPATISQITEKIWPLVEAWQTRNLEAIYPFVFLDAIHLNLKRDGRIQNTAVYICLGISPSGHKDILGHWVGDGAEGANFWLSVVTDLKNRGVQDVFIACVDGLTGFGEAIRSVFPGTQVQRCITHQIRNSLKYVGWKDKKELADDLKTIYQAPTEKAGKSELEKVAEKWMKKYPLAIKSWQTNWAELSPFFQFTPEIRRIMYTTNGIESYNHSLRKMTKTKASFPTQESLEKVLYLAYRNAKKKWDKSLPNWALIMNQLAIHFEGRFTV